MLGLPAGLTLLVLLSGAALYALVHRVLVGQFDQLLESRARGLTVLVEWDDDLVDLDDLLALPGSGAGHDGNCFELRAADGQLLLASGVPDGQTLQQPTQADGYWNLTLADGRRARALQWSFQAREDDARLPPAAPRPEMALTYAASRVELDRQLRVLALALGAFCLLLPPGLTAMVWAQARRGLRPLDQLAAAAAAIDPAHLDRRFADEGLPAELRPIAAALNSLLDRLQRAFTRERRFTADIAHELRTPIAELRTMTEVALLEPAGVAMPPPDLLIDILELSLQMDRLVSSLLTLARNEAGLEPARRRPVDPVELARAQWNARVARARERSLTLNWNIEAPVLLHADPDMLAMALGILFDNAIDHAPAGDHLRLTLTSRDGLTRLSLTNTNPGLQPEDVAQMFEPFWQKDPSRGDGAHSGIGLALLAALCRPLALGCTARLDADGRLVIELCQATDVAALVAPATPQQISL